MLLDPHRPDPFTLHSSRVMKYDLECSLRYLNFVNSSEPSGDNSGVSVACSDLLREFRQDSSFVPLLVA